MTYPLLGLVCILLTACAVTSDLNSDLGDDDWTIFRGSSALNGYVERHLPDMPVLKWTFANDVRTVASPIIYGGNAYTCDRKGVIRGIDRNGKQFFTMDLNTPIEGSFVIRDSILYVGRIDGFLSAISLSERKVVWEYETEGQISASPNIIRHDADDMLLIGSYDTNMYTFSLTDGKNISTFSTGYYINGAASVWKHYMLFGGCDGWLRMVNTLTGEMTDSIQTKAYIPASPAVMGNNAYVSDYNGNLYELQLTDGKIVNTRMLISVTESNEQSGVVSMPTVTPSSVLILTGDRYIRCLDRKSGKEKWNRLLRGDTGESAPLACLDKVIVCTKDGHVSILGADDGKELWHYEVGEQIIASPAILRDGFYIQTSRGKLLYFSNNR